MSRVIRKLHRKQAEFTNFSSNETAELSEPNKTSEENTESVKFKAEAALERSDVAAYNLGNNSNEIDSIRAELLEDDYHSKLTEPSFSDDTHDRNGKNEELSSEYWHFVGSYE